MSLQQKVDWTVLNEKLPTETLSDDQVEQRRIIFNQYFDINQNGYCSLAECDKGILELLSSVENASTIFTKPVILRAFTSAKVIATEHGSTSTTGGDYIEFSEFRWFFIYLKEYAKLWEVFDTIDTDNDRRINVNEFITNAMPKLIDYGAISENEASDAESIFRSIDTNNGGQILFIELVEYAIRKKTNQL